MTVLLAVAVAAGALAQSVSGIGFVLVCGPALVAVLGQAEGVRLAVVLSTVVNVGLLLRGRRQVDGRAALVLLIPALVATPVAAWALHAAPERVAAALAGVAAVGGAAAVAVGLRWPAARGRLGAAGAGVVSAAMNVAAGIGGPAVALWTANAGWAQERAHATLQAYFLGLNAVALVVLGPPHRPAGQLLAVGAALVIGLGAGHLVADRVPAAAARRTTLALAAAGGLVVLARALWEG